MWGGVLFCNSHSVAAQTTVTGANVTKFEATSVETQPQMFVTPLAADLMVIQSASTSFQTKGTITIPEAPDTRNPDNLKKYMDLVRSTITTSIEELKAQALFEFSEETGADVIISPTFSVITENSEDRQIHVRIKVKGFPAKYTNFRNLKPEDRSLVDINRMLTLQEGKDVRVLSATESSHTEKEEEILKK